MQRCRRCRQFRFYPRPMCPQCRCKDGEWLKMTGRGQLYSWVVVHPPVLAAFRNRAPYPVGLVALEEEPRIRLIGMLLECRAEHLAPGMPLQVTFEDIGDVSLPQWKPRRKIVPHGLGGT